MFLIEIALPRGLLHRSGAAWSGVQLQYVIQSDCYCVQTYTLYWINGYGSFSKLLVHTSMVTLGNKCCTPCNKAGDY